MLHIQSPRTLQQIGYHVGGRQPSHRNTRTICLRRRTVPGRLSTWFILSTIGGIVTRGNRYGRTCGEGVEESRADMCPADQQQRANRIKRGLSPFAGKEWISYVQR